MDTRSSLVLPEVKALLALGMYESAETRLVQKHLRSDLPVVELGASLGYVTCHIARRHPPRQIAVEPNPYLLPLIRDLLRLNALDGVQVIHGAIDYAGCAMARLHVHAVNTRSALSDRDPSSDATNLAEVPAFSLGALLAREDVGAFTLVSDIEGAERAMIMEEGHAVMHRCSQMCIELHAGVYGVGHLSVDDLTRAIRERWGMEVLARDGNNWVFQRRQPTD